MSPARSTTPVLLLLGLSACTCQLAPAPLLGAVEPAQARTDVLTLLAIRGEHFLPRVKVDFDSPNRSPADSTFELWLVAGETRVALSEVRLVSDGALSAWYAGLSAAPGTYDLELLDARGNHALLPQGFTVIASKCAGLPDGTPCDDGDACTAGETCQVGTCRSPTSVVTCTPGTCVASAACDPATGLCVDILMNDGSACSDGNACTASASCLAGVCVRSALVSCAPPAECRLPGTCDPATQTCEYLAGPDGTSCLGPGTCFAGGVCHAGGCACAEVRVTTEADSGAGSLRAAIDTVNALGVPQAITFAGPYQIVLASALPALQTDGAVIVGLPGVVLDCTAVNRSCLSVSGAGRILGLELSGSSNGAIQLDGAGYQVAGCRIVNGSDKGASVGILASGTGTIGPGNDISGAHYGIEVSSTGIAIDGNRIHANAIGVGASGGVGGLAIQRNFVYSNATNGVAVSNCSGTFWLNTVDGNGLHGLAAGTQTALDVRDNLFTNNAGNGVSGAASLSPFDYNGFFGNTLPAADAPLGAHDVTADPRFVDRIGGDFRLLPGSPAIDAGADVGVDVNGPAPGNYDGAAPDLGAAETP